MEQKVRELPNFFYLYFLFLYFSWMKLAISILLLFVSLGSNAQYKKLINENKEWVIKNDYYDQQQSPLPGETTYYFSFFQGDTILNSVIYKKLYHQRFHLNSHYYNPPNPYIDDTLRQSRLAAFLREDTITQQVFIINNWQPNLPSEELLFDFSLNSGDTFQHINLNTPIIDSTSEIVLINNDTCKLLYFDRWFQSINNLDANYMIEGIGGPGGISHPFLFNYVSGSTTRTEIVCYKENNVQLFSNCNYPNFINGINEFKNHNIIKVYPNPTSNQLTISLEKEKSIALTLRNSLRQLLLSEKHPTTNQLIIDISAYPAGIYFLQVEVDGEIITQKIVKK
jgi:hypothetical protein